MTNVLIQDPDGQWWKFVGIEGRLFEFHWPEEEFAIGYEQFMVAEAPVIVGQSGNRTYGEKCKPIVVKTDDL
jgi:hypothetical protein